jgi:hypothetical protein
MFSATSRAIESARAAVTESPAFRKASAAPPYTIE